MIGYTRSDSSCTRRLWSALEPLALFSPPQNVDYACLAAMSTKLRQWYFTGGGLVMTPHTRDVYFLVQEALVRATETNKGGSMLRDASEVLTLDGMDTRRRDLKIPTLSPPSPSAGDHNGAERQVGQVRRMLNESWKFADPANDYVLMQYLTSTLRTTVTVELQSRALPLQSSGSDRNEF